jgi:CRISPR-associated endonuclease/helicase Cas3
MCPVHRSQKLNEIRERLQNGQPCRVISTQLVEAGVDIDFPVVYRALAGIDSIAQAAGRCNREGRLEKGKVYVFIPEEGTPAGYFRQTAQTAESVIRRFPDDILSLEAIEDYFRNYYWLKGDRLDEKGILGKLQAGVQKGDFPFNTIAEEFRLIDDNTKSVIIPFDDEARKLIRELDFVENPRLLSRKLQKYSVSIYPREYDKLFSARSIDIKGGLFPVLVDEALYDDNLGLLNENPMDRNPESLVI